MNIIYTLLVAMICGVLIIMTDIAITINFDEDSILQKQYVKMPIAYGIGIAIFLIFVRLIFGR